MIWFHRLHPLLVVTAIVLAGCSSREPGESGGGTARAETRPAEPELPPAEDPNESTKRLLTLERAVEQWYVAYQSQEYDRCDQLELLLNDYTSDHFDEIVSDLRFGSPRRRAVMAAALGFSARQEAVPPLLEALRDQTYEVVLHALLSLYNLAGTESDLTGRTEVDVDIEPAELTPYLRHPRPEVRSNTALALSRVLDEESRREHMLPLVAAAEDEDATTRVHAMAALGATRRREALPHLIRGLDDGTELVRIRAALALARIGDPDAVPHLIEILERPDEKIDVRRAAARALHSMLGGEPTLDPSDWKDRARSAGVTGPKIEDGPVGR